MLNVVNDPHVLSRDHSDSLAHMIVFDLYGLEGKTELLLLLRQMLTRLYHTQQRQPKASGADCRENNNSFNKDFVLEHNSILSKLLHNYLILVGEEYLMNVVRFVMYTSCYFCNILVVFRYTYILKQSKIANQPNQSTQSINK